jgi:hypothetical protein
MVRGVRKRAPEATKMDLEKTMSARKDSEGEGGKDS